MDQVKKATTTVKTRYPPPKLRRARLPPTCRKLRQRLAAQAVGQPVLDPAQADLLVEAAGRVPVEHVEVDALETLGGAFLGQRRHQRAGDAAAALLGHHPDVLDEDAARTGPYRVVEGVEHEADRLAGHLGDQ